MLQFYRTYDVVDTRAMLMQQLFISHTQIMENIVFLRLQSCHLINSCEQISFLNQFPLEKSFVILFYLINGYSSLRIIIIESIFLKETLPLRCRIREWVDRGKVILYFSQRQRFLVFNWNNLYLKSMDLLKRTFDVEA